MAILWILERRAFGAVLLGIPIIISILCAEMMEFVSNYGLIPPTVEEVLHGELELLANGSLKSSALDIPILLWWTPFSVDGNRLRECGRSSCIVSRDRKLLDHPTTEAVFFYGTDFDLKDLPERRKDQDWALLHEESPKNNAIFNFDSTLRLFNHTATFRSYSDLPLGTLNLDSLDSLVDNRYLVSPEEKRILQSEQGLAPVVYIQSACDCPSRRDDLVKRLSEHIGIDSYGECLNNKSMPEPKLKNQAISSRESLLSLLAKYKFVLALENAECPDYVTEKLWNALTVGSVPVYLGAPNAVKDYLPRGKSSAILVSDFGSAEELADKLKTLDADNFAYKRMLAHKRRYAPADGSPIKNKNLVKLMIGRKWGITEKDQMDKGSYVNHFECLVCQRLNERATLVKAGFGEAEPRQADKDHYGCPYPNGALSVWTKEKSLIHEEREGLKLWQDLYTDGFVKSVYLSIKVKKGEVVTEEGLAKLFGYPKVALIEENIGKVRGDSGKLKAYEEELKILIREENL